MLLPEKRLHGREDETIVFQEGWIKGDILGDRGWFCKVTMDGFCVEAFASSKWGALRIARRYWRKAKGIKNHELYGYPRVCDGKGKAPTQFS